MTTQSADGSHVNPWLVALVVSIATFMEVLDTTITNVSLSHIAGTLSASQDESTWVLTSYLVANGIVLPLSGWLSSVFGRKRFFMMCIGGFTAASFACGSATSLDMLIFFRLIQGLAGGGLQPIQQAIILDAFPPEKRGAVFGITGITLIVAPILGPTLGGWITDNYSWRWIFYLNIPVGIFAFYMVNRLVRDPEHARAQGAKHIDGIGLGLIALGFGALQIMLDKGQQDDWFESNFILATSVIAALSIGCAIRWLLRQSDPIVDLRLLGERSFGLCSILIFFTGFVLYGTSALLPLLLQTQFGYNATLAGLVLSPGGLAVVFLMPLAGKLVSKVQARYLIAIGMALMSYGMWMSTQITPQTDYHHFVMMRIFQVLGLPFLFIPISTLAFAKIPKEKSSKASALFALSRNLGGSMGIAIIGSYVARHTQMHQQVLASNLIPGDPVYEHTLSTITQQFVAHGMTAFSAGRAAFGHLYRELIHQSAILAYGDGFAFMGMLALVGVALTMILPPNYPRAAKTSDAPPAH
ncbi:MAG: DHA2 family efflux MFS transporter permease subunit [Pseudomonadota bacterium]